MGEILLIVQPTQWNEYYKCFQQLCVIHVTLSGNINITMDSCTLAYKQTVG